jgi:hypothetical protein
MPRGDKSKYTDKQIRTAQHIEDGYKKRGASKELAASIAWATVNKQDGGGKKSGSGRGRTRDPTPAREGGAAPKPRAKRAAAKKSAAKRSTAKKTAATRGPAKAGARRAARPREATAR